MNQVLIAYHVRVAGNPDDVRLSPELLEYRWVTPKPRAAGRRARATRWPTGSATRAWSHNSGLPSRPEPGTGSRQVAAAAMGRRCAVSAAAHPGVTPPEPRCGFPFPVFPRGLLQRVPCARWGSPVRRVRRPPPGVVVHSRFGRRWCGASPVRAGRYRCPSQGCCRLSTMALRAAPKAALLREPHAD
jgi:hypothetical protein